MQFMEQLFKYVPLCTTIRYSTRHQLTVPSNSTGHIPSTLLSRLCYFILNLKLASFKPLIHHRLPLCLMDWSSGYWPDYGLVLACHRLMTCALDTSAIEVIERTKPTWQAFQHPKTDKPHKSLLQASRSQCKKEPQNDAEMLEQNSGMPRYQWPKHVRKLRENVQFGAFKLVQFTSIAALQ